MLRLKVPRGAFVYQPVVIYHKAVPFVCIAQSSPACIVTDIVTMILELAFYRRIFFRNAASSFSCHIL